MGGRCCALLVNVSDEAVKAGGLKRERKNDVQSCEMKGVDRKEGYEFMEEKDGSVNGLHFTREDC